jgi:hypothetical protein
MLEPGTEAGLYHASAMAFKLYSLVGTASSRPTDTRSTNDNLVNSPRRISVAQRLVRKECLRRPWFIIKSLISCCGYWGQRV